MRYVHTPLCDDQSKQYLYCIPRNPTLRICCIDSTSSVVFAKNTGTVKCVNVPVMLILVLFLAFYFLNNSVKSQPILIIFGMQHPEETTKKNINVPASPTNSCRTTAGSATTDLKKCSTSVQVKGLLFTQFYRIQNFKFVKTYKALYQRTLQLSVQNDLILTELQQNLVQRWTN